MRRKKKQEVITKPTATNNDSSEQKIKSESKTAKEIILTCPKCKEGKMIKGKTAFGCNRFKDGCSFKISFEFGGKKLSDKQIQTLIQKKKTPSVKGFLINNKKANGHLILTNEFNLEFIEETSKNNVPVSITASQSCPKCKQGTIIKGKSSYGCNRFKEGCDFRAPFMDA